MIAALIAFLTKYMNKKVATVLTIIVLTIVGLFYITNYFVTAGELDQEIAVVNNKINMETLKLANEDTSIKKDIKMKSQQQQLDMLYMQQDIAQRQVWDLDSRVDEARDVEKKDKWKRRLERAVEQLQKIMDRIDELKKEISS